MSSQATAQSVPATEKPIRRSDRISVVGTAIALCFIIGALVLFNGFPDKIGTYRTLGDETTFRPLLSANFRQFMPLINTWFGLALSLSLAHLAFRRWTLITRAADLALTLFGCYIWVELIQGGPILAYDPDWILWNGPVWAFGRAWHAGDWIGVTALLGVALVITALSALVKLIQLMVHAAREL